MAVIQIKYSLTTGHIPSVLQFGELAINLADAVVYWLDDDGSTIQHFNLLAPQGPTMGAGDATSNLANTNFVTGAIATAVNNLLGSPAPPAALNTFAELAAAINNSPTFGTDTNNAIAVRLRFDAAQALNTTQQAQIRDNLNLLGYLVRYDAAQTLTTTQQTQVQANIGIGAAGGVVRYDTVQTLTAPQQAQAQSNIGIPAGITVDGGTF